MSKNNLSQKKGSNFSERNNSKLKRALEKKE